MQQSKLSGGSIRNISIFSDSLQYSKNPHIRTKIPRNLTQANCRICPDPRLFIVLGLGEIFQKITVDITIRKLPGP